MTNMGHFKFKLDLYLICIQIVLKLQVNLTNKTSDNFLKPKVDSIFLKVSLHALQQINDLILLLFNSTKSAALK
jgi:hypothetical protein